MRKLLVLVALTSLSCAFAAQDKRQGVDNDNANMSSDNGDGTFTNPVIRADYPDPDIIRVGEDYYLVSSSFVCMPGIPICHSKDLINWKIIGHAYDSINFQPQYRMEGGKTAYSRICWAPSFKYKDGIYYIGVNIKDDGFVMYKSDRPEEPYKMYKYNKTLYDPGFFIDDDGKKYVTHGKTKIYLTRAFNDANGGYLANGLENKDIYYMKHVYCGLVRCIDFLTSLPEWDGKNVAVQGGSQGGALAIIAAGLDKRVIQCVANHPALSDMAGYVEKGRTGGYPHFNKQPQILGNKDCLNTLSYFDVVNFARYVKADTYLTWGYNDNTCPPTTSYAVWNTLKCKKELLLTPINEHWTSEDTNKNQMEWIKAHLVK